MKKGVSPVVATVVLIMMAVMAAVAVWYWVSSSTTKPPLPETSQKGYTVVDIYKNASNTGCNALDIKNTGGLPLNNLILEVREYGSGKVVGINGTDPNPVNQTFVNISSEIAAGNTIMENFSFLGLATNRTSVPVGTYLLRVSSRTTSGITGYTDQSFTCS
jgi:flagellin-like protein